MKFNITAIKENPASLLMRAGYTFQKNVGDEMSFIRPLATSGYPRFHMYVKVDGINMVVSLHLDQKKHTYGEETRHHGEYEDSKLLQEEAERLMKFLM